MKSRLEFQFPDFLALAIIFACFILIALGKNSTISFVLTSITAFYFGNKYKK